MKWMASELKKKGTIKKGINGKAVFQYFKKCTTVTFQILIMTL